MIKAKPISYIDLIPGDILVYSKKACISRAIQILTRSKYNHTGTIGSDGYVYEALQQGYVKQKVKESVKDSIQVIVQRPLHPINVNALDSAIFDMKDAKYEFIGIWYEIKHQLWGGWKGDKEVKKNVFCSKASAYIEFKQGNETYNKWWDISPDEIAENMFDFETFELILYNI